MYVFNVNFVIIDDLLNQVLLTLIVDYNEFFIQLGITRQMLETIFSPICNQIYVSVTIVGFYELWV